MSDVIDYYKHKISNLRVDRSRGLAPHKPILLLSLIELFQYGKIHENKIYPTPLITSTFLKYWSKLYPESPKTQISLPFFHLKSDGFWHLHPNKGYEKVLNFAKSIRSFSELRKVVHCATLDDNLFLLLSNKEYREILRDHIVETYLPDKREILMEIFKETEELENYQKELIVDVHKHFIPIKDREVNEKRKIAFRNSIMSIYDYTCAICKIQLITINGESIVDAAHIIPFRISHNNDIRNGFALCKNHHWCFDRGLITIDEEYRIMISPLIDNQKIINELSHKVILLPKTNELYPSQDAFEWHRKNIFQV